MPTQEELHQMSQMCIRNIDKTALVNSKDVKINPDLPIEKRFQSFLEQIKNPYCFYCGKIAVKMNFSSNGKSLADKLTDHFIRKKTE